MPFGNLFGLTKKLDFIDEAERLGNTAAKLAKDTYETATSGEKFVNELPGIGLGTALTAPFLGPLAPAAGALFGGKFGDLLGNPKAGTATKNFLDKNTPYGIGGTAFDIAASPLTIATAGAGSSLGAALQGTKLGAAAPFVTPVVSKGGFLGRLGGETLTGLGAVGGSELANKSLPEGTPGSVRMAAGIAGGLVGGGIGANIANRSFRTRLPQEAMVPKPEEITDPVVRETLGLEPLTKSGEWSYQEARKILGDLSSKYPNGGQDYSPADLELYKKAYGRLLEFNPTDPRTKLQEYDRSAIRPSLENASPQEIFDRFQELDTQLNSIHTDLLNIRGIKDTKPNYDELAKQTNFLTEDMLNIGTKLVKLGKLTPEDLKRTMGIRNAIYKEIPARSRGQAVIEFLSGQQGNEQSLLGITNPLSKPKRVWAPGDLEAAKSELSDIRNEQIQYSALKRPMSDDEWQNYLELEKQASEIVTQLPKTPAPKQGLYSNVNNTLRALGAGMDESALGVQMLLGYGSTEKSKQLQVILTGLKSLYSEDAWAKRSMEWDREALTKGHPTSAQWYSGNNPLVNLSPKSIPGTEGATSWVNEIPGFKHTTRSFDTLINAQARAMGETLFDMVENGGAMLTTGFTKGSGWDNLEAIKNTANRTVGYSNTKLPTAIREGFFAPTFIRANAEIAWKAFTDGTLEGQVARRQLAKLAAVGTAITYAANTARGYHTELDPRDSNFMRIRNVGGVDISPFGYVDTMVRGLALAANDPLINPIAAAVHGELQAPKPPSISDLMYLVRSKAAPLLGFGIDLFRNQTFTGANPREPGELLKQALPFSTRQIGQEPIVGTALGALGIKATPLSPTEILNQKLERAGIKTDNPDYAIQKRDYLYKHPEDQPQYSGDISKARDVQTDIRTRMQDNEAKLTSGQQTIQQWRDARTTLLNEQRNKLSMLDIGTGTKRGKQGEWINSFIKMYSDPSLLDPITHSLVADKFDEAVSKWTSEHGADAYDYVQRYLDTGHSPVETQYLQDLQKLQKLGYFDISHFKGLISGVDEKQLNQLRGEVSAIRSADPRLKDASFSRAAQVILGNNYPREVLIDVVRMGLASHANPEFTKFKRQHADLLQWFNPNATYDSLTRAKGLAA